MIKNNRPKKVNTLDKASLKELVAYLIKYKKVALNNLCVIELKETEGGSYYNVATGQTETSPAYRVYIKKARYLKDEIARQLKDR